MCTSWWAFPAIRPWHAFGDGDDDGWCVKLEMTPNRDLVISTCIGISCVRMFALNDDRSQSVANGWCQQLTYAVCQPPSSEKQPLKRLMRNLLAGAKFSVFHQARLVLATITFTLYSYACRSSSLLACLSIALYGLCCMITTVCLSCWMIVTAFHCICRS